MITPRRRPFPPIGTVALPTLALTLTATLAACAPDPAGHGDPTTTLTGQAEDLWDTPIDLGHLPGLVLIEPISPSNCGYCLVDGAFIQANYFAPNAAAGGRNFYQCLFNPQRDIQAYLKHLRSAGVPVLTFPPTLHRYHRNGFPFLIAFRDRQAIYQSYSQPYEEKVRELGALFWPGRPVQVVLTSPSHMAGRFVFENETGIGIIVVPDGDAEALQRWLDRKAQWRGNPGEPKYEGDLTAEDLGKNLYFTGAIDRFRLAALQDPEAPVRIDAVKVQIGPHTFPRSEIALRAAYPNPHNRERYVQLSLQGEGGSNAPGNNWADYAVYAVYAAAPRATPGAPADGRAMQPPALLLEGLFQTLPGNRWVFADSLCFGPSGAEARPPAAGETAGETAAAPCTGSSCPAPVAWNPEVLQKPAAPQAPATTDLAATGELAAHGLLWTLGTAPARFPALAPGADGSCWVAWEERGDIYLAHLGETAPSADAVAEAGAGTGGQAGTTVPAGILAVEHDPSDSYDPVLAAAGDDMWVFYLNDRDGFYRLRARCLRGGAWSAEQLVSEMGPVDVITPAAAVGPGGGVIVAWSVWKANQRFLEYRAIAGDALGPVAVAAAAPSELEDYTNAWYPSLAFAADGKPWGAWNQHYPASLSVCAGNLVSPAAAVTRVVADHDASENGGYPAAVVDGAGDRWVIWESFGWDVLSGTAQAILAAHWDTQKGAWGTSQALSTGAQTFFNQTPSAALDAGGVLWVAWSGRDRIALDMGAGGTNPEDKAEHAPWGIYAVRREGDAWSEPMRISPEGTCARAPRVCASGADVWIAWHTGVGDAMRIQVLRTARGAR
jgi:hypothetical protein